MSPLAFDKQGKPFAWHRRTRKLLVRMFRNPAARGTCCQVLDAEGNPLYIDAETDYGEFRKEVGNVPGLYRLDQCDEDGVEIDDAQPAYVSIDLTRNASLSGDDGDVNPLVIIEHMFAIHADVMKTMAMQQASIMAASAEILRAPFRPPVPAVEREPRDEDEDEDEADDELEPEQEPDPWAAWRPMLKMATPALNKLGELLFAQFVAFVKKSATPPAAAPSSAPAAPPASAHTDASSVDAAHAAAAAGSSAPASQAAAATAASAPASSVQSGIAPSNSVASSAIAGSTAASSTTAPASAASTRSTTSTATASATTAPGSAPPIATPTAKPSSPTSGASLAVVPAAGEPAPRNGALSPTPDQWEHLHEIRERLSPKERAIAENAIMRMDADVLAQYLAELSAQSVDDAVATIRSMIATLPTRGRDRGER